MEWKDHNRRAVNLKWERFEHRWISFHACSLSQPYQSRKKSVLKKYCLKVKDCERVIDVNKITTNPRQQRANELQNKINVQTYRVLLGPNVSWPMTEGKKWMQNLPTFPVALEQTFQSSRHFRFQAVTKVFLTISSLLRLSSLFQKEHTTSVGKYVHQFPFSFISCLPLRFFSFSCRLIWLSLEETKTKKYDASLAHILELFRQAQLRLIQRYSSLNYRYTARDQIRGLRIIWTFC